MGEWETWHARTAGDGETGASHDSAG